MSCGYRYFYGMFAIVILTNNIMQCDKMANFATISLADAIKLDHSIKVTPCGDSSSFSYAPFPLSNNEEAYPNRGYLYDLFICTIPQGQLCSFPQFFSCWIMFKNKIIENFMWPSKTYYLEYKQYYFGYKTNIAIDMLNINDLRKRNHIAGKVAVITQKAAYNYYHWMIEVLGRLAMLEIAGIEYDWLYVPTNKPFMKETLELWGVDSSKIISVADYPEYFQADQLIIPSLVARLYPAHVPFVTYTPVWIIEYLRNKFLPIAEQKSNLYNFAKKVFISRKSAQVRLMLNEDEVFALFEQKGFVQYRLEELSFLEQVILFKNAEIIVGAHGAGLINAIFCDPGTKIIEIFQSRGDATFWFQSQILGLEHVCVKTVDFQLPGMNHTVVPLELIKEVVKRL